MKRSHLARDIVEIIAIALVVFVAIHFTVQNYQVSDTSMENTLHNGQIVLVNKIAYVFHNPARGDIIVFLDPTDPVHDLLRRVIGLPGDTITLDGTAVSVDGVQLNEPYITQKFNPVAESVTVPAGEYFAVADNRPTIHDSRTFGFVPRASIVGRAIVVYWPLNQWQILNTYPSVYAQIK